MYDVYTANKNAFRCLQKVSLLTAGLGLSGSPAVSSRPTGQPLRKPAARQMYSSSGCGTFSSRRSGDWRWRYDASSETDWQRSSRRRRWEADGADIDESQVLNVSRESYRSTRMLQVDLYRWLSSRISHNGSIHKTLSTVGGRAFPVARRSIWNNLPETLCVALDSANIHYYCDFSSYSVYVPPATENLSVFSLLPRHYTTLIDLTSSTVVSEVIYTNWITLKTFRLIDWLIEWSSVWRLLRDIGEKNYCVRSFPDIILHW